MEKERILIIDGDEKVHNELLKSLGKEYKVDTAITLKDAQKLIKDQTYDIVIAELDIPEMQGVEVLRKLKESESETPIIVVTTYKSVSLAVQAMKIGAYDYITKPFNLDELRLAVTHALERQKLVTEVKEKRMYQELAIMDGLTQVYNRRYFDELLSRETERAIRYPQKFSLIMLDVDDFKKCNDTYGHLGGDKVLQGIAKTIFSKMRNTDYLARYGGEEFAVISPQTGKKGASILAGRIIALIADQQFLVEDNTKINVTVSAGVATFNEDAKTKEDLIRRTDEALYQAKKLGKNRFCMLGDNKNP